MKIEELSERDPDKVGGTPVFPGTRVPIEHLFDSLEGGESIETFLDKFPGVSRGQVVAVLNASRESLLDHSTNSDARMDLMQEAATDELFLADLNATMDDFGHADQEEDLSRADRIVPLAHRLQSYDPSTSQNGMSESPGGSFVKLSPRSFSANFRSRSHSSNLCCSCVVNEMGTTGEESHSA